MTSGWNAWLPTSRETAIRCRWSGAIASSACRNRRPATFSTASRRHWTSSRRAPSWSWSPAFPDAGSGRRHHDETTREVDAVQEQGQPLAFDVFVDGLFRTHEVPVVVDDQHTVG